MKLGFEEGGKGHALSPSSRVSVLCLEDCIAANGFTGKAGTRYIVSYRRALELIASGNFSLSMGAVSPLMLSRLK